LPIDRNLFSLPANPPPAAGAAGGASCAEYRRIAVGFLIFAAFKSTFLGIIVKQKLNSSALR
jgi:hypothetical protein